MSKKKFVILLFTLGIGVVPLLTNAQFGDQRDVNNFGNQRDINTGGNVSSGPISLINPLTGTAKDVDGGIPAIIGRVIKAALGIVGSLALVMFIYGGLLWMISGGNDEKVKQGVQILIWATAGLALVFFSYLLVNFLIKGITKQSLSGQNTSNSIDQEKLREKGLVP